MCPYFVSLVPGRETDTLRVTAACLSIRLPAGNQQKIPEVDFLIYKTNIHKYPSTVQFIFLCKSRRPPSISREYSIICKTVKYGTLRTVKYFTSNSFPQQWHNVYNYCKCIVFYYDSNIRVCRIPDNGGWSPKYVGGNKKLHCYIFCMYVYWVYKNRKKNNSLQEIYKLREFLEVRNEE